MTQLSYDDICMLIGRTILENEKQLKSIFEELVATKKENEELKRGPAKSAETSK